jgi:hypothetical protein
VQRVVSETPRAAPGERLGGIRHNVSPDPTLRRHTADAACPRRIAARSDPHPALHLVTVMCDGCTFTPRYAVPKSVSHCGGPYADRRRLAQGVLMQQNSSPSETALARLTMTVLLALGLALVDLTIVQPQDSAAAKPTSNLATAGDDSFNVLHLSSSGPAISPACAKDGCQPAASSSFMGRPGAVVTRVSPQGEPGITRPTAAPARVAPLSMVPPAPAFTADCRYLLDLPWHPARQSGADRSVPRPPPV